MIRMKVLVVSFLVSGNVLAEDISDAFIKCATTKDDRQRLACYDRIRDQIVEQYKSNAQQSQYSRINLADLKTDLRQLLGRKVETSGKIQVMGGLEMIMLKTDELDMAPVMMQADGLPRDDRKKLLNSCQVVLCKASVSGTIRKGSMGNQLVAEKVLWQ